MPSPEKRRHDFDKAGPSCTSAPMGEPDYKRGRISEPEPLERNLMFDRNNDRDFRDESNIDRSYMNQRNLNRVDDRSIDLRHLDDDRQTDGFQMDGRGSMDRGFMGNQPGVSRHLEDRGSDFGCMRSQPNNYNMDMDRMISVEKGDRQDVQRGNNRMGDYRGVDDLSADFEVRRLVGSNNFDRGESSMILDRMRHITETNYDERENEPNYNQRENEFGRLNDFRNRSIERMQRSLLFDDIQRPSRDNLRSGMDNQLGSMFNSSVADRRNYGRELTERDNRDSFSMNASNFQDAMNNRVYDTLHDRVDKPPGLRQITPDRLLRRDGVNADRFFNQSADEDAFGSLQNFGSRRVAFRDREQDSSFDFIDKRNDFLNDINNEPGPSRWDGASRDAYRQDRQEFDVGMDSRRRNNFDLDREVNLNVNANDDFDDNFRNMNPRSFERRHIDNRFNRFN